MRLGQRARCAACRGACAGLLALAVAASRAGLTLAAIALASDVDKKAMAALASRASWPHVEGGADAWAVLHHHDPSFGTKPV